MKYDVKYEISKFIKKIYLKLIKIENIIYYILKSFSLFIKKIDFHKILKKVNLLTYKLKLAFNISRFY